MTTAAEGAAPAAKSHGVDPTAEITAKDNVGAFADPPAGGQQKTAPAAAAGDLYFPQGFPDHLKGATANETLDKAWAAYSGARTELAKGAPAIPQPGEYQWNWSEQVKATKSIGPDDPAIKEFASIAHEHGYTQRQIDAVPKLFDKLVEKGLIEKPFDSGKLLEELAPETFKGTPEERQARGGERLGQAEAWIKQLDPTTHGFDEGMKQELRLLTTSRDGVRVVEKLMNSGMVASVNPGGQGGQQAITKEALDQRTADPRNDSTNHAKFDPDFAKETRRLYQQFYG